MSHWEGAGISGSYAAFRPTYPAELYTTVLQELEANGVRRGGFLDLGCGSGQAFLPVARHFERSFARDVSQSQADACRAAVAKRFTADEAAQCDVGVGGAADFNLPAGADGPTLDLITVAQAMHWFPMQEFNAQLHRHLRPGGYFVTWLYGLNRLEPAGCDTELQAFDRMLTEKTF